MRILAVDTTSFYGSVALLDNMILQAEINIISPMTHSERLLPAIRFILQSQGLEIKDMDGFAVAAGPGSFTGIRIGLSTVKSFSYASQKPVAAVSGLKALALKIKMPHSRLLCPFIDAKKGEVYTSLFESRKNKLKEIVPQNVYTPDRFLSLLPRHRIISFIGTGVAPYKKKILEYFPDKARFSPRSLFIAHEVGLLGQEIIHQKKAVDFHRLKPLYFRKSQAEDKD